LTAAWREAAIARLALSILTAALGLAASAGPSGADEPEGFVLEDALALPPRPIEPRTVTAPRRKATEEATPIAVDVFSGEALDRAGVDDTRELPRLEPSLVFKTNTVLGQPYLRGIGSDLITSGADPSVATFVDDVYRARPASALQNLYDVDRIEVVKGPLGTLFGRNATGGAIRIFTKRPEPERSAEGDVSYGNFDALRIRGAVNVPLVDDRLMLRASGLFSDHDGYSRNFFLEEDLDDEHLGSGRVQLLAQPSESVELLLRGDYLRRNDSRGLGQHPDVTCCLNGGLLLGGLTSDDPRRVANDVEQNAEIERWGTSLHATWEPAPGWTLTSISAFRHEDTEERLDLDATDVPFASNRFREASRTWTQELQLGYEGDGPLSGLVGAYYLQEDAEQELNVALPVFGVLNQPDGDGESESVALFGEARLELLPELAATAGLRLSREWRRQRFRQILRDPAGALGPPGTAVVAADQRERWSVYTPRFVLEWAPHEDVLAWASASRGFKAGGFNTNAFQPAFDPETVWSWEVGTKAALLGERLRLSTSAFYYDYEDLQILTLPPGASAAAYPIVENAAEATIWGVEADLRVRPLGGLDLHAGVAYLDARFDEFVSVDPNVPTGDPDRGGERMPHAPRWSVVLDATWERDLGWGVLEAHADWSWRSSILYNPFQDPNVRQGPYDVAGARLRLHDAEEHWSIALFGRNLADETYATNVVRQDPLIGALRIWGPPRTFGVELGFRL
jgi:iron complex outermembrane receptor protein